MVPRRIPEQPVSKLAIWARRVTLFSLVATVMAVITVRSGALDIVPALSTLAGALLLAVAGILLAFCAGVVIWREGFGGLRQAVWAVLIGLMLLAYPLYLGAKAYKLPAIYDVTTDPIDPPQFDALAKLRPRDANPITYEGLYAAELQRVAYPDVQPEETTATPQEAFAAVMKIITRRRWKIVDARPPQEDASPRVVNARRPQPVRISDGMIEAIAFTPLLNFREDLVVRVRATSDGARIDVRSASRYGRHDLGTNAARVDNLITDIDDILSTPQPEKAAPRTAQPPAKGRSARR